MAIVFLVLAADNFIRPNENPLSGGGRWSVDTITPIAPLQLLNDVAVLTDIGESNSLYTGIIWPNVQWAEVTIEECLDGSCSDLLVMHRQDAENGYVFEIDGPLGPTCNVDIFTLIGGTPRDILFTGTLEINKGDVIRLECPGGFMRAYLNGVLFIEGPVTPLPAGVSNLDAFGHTAVTDCQFSNFRGGEIATEFAHSVDCFIASTPSTSLAHSVDCYVFEKTVDSLHNVDCSISSATQKPTRGARLRVDVTVGVTVIVE